MKKVNKKQKLLQRILLNKKHFQIKILLMKVSKFYKKYLEQ